jgi:hypothetical protein
MPEKDRRILTLGAIQGAPNALRPLSQSIDGLLSRLRSRTCVGARPIAGGLGHDAVTLQSAAAPGGKRALRGCGSFASVLQRLRLLNAAVQCLFPRVASSRTMANRDAQPDPWSRPHSDLPPEEERPPQTPSDTEGCFASDNDKSQAAKRSDAAICRMSRNSLRAQWLSGNRGARSCWSKRPPPEREECIEWSSTNFMRA